MREVHVLVKSEPGHSLNNFLEKRPSLQNKLWDTLIRTRFVTVISFADTEKAFLQILIRENERVTLKFQWIKNLTSNTIQILHFTRLVLGLNHSPFRTLQTRMLKIHFETYEIMYLELIRKIIDNMNVHDLMTGGKAGRELRK